MSKKKILKLSLIEKFSNNVRYTMVNHDVLANNTGLLLDLDIWYFKDLNFYGISFSNKTQIGLEELKKLRTLTKTELFLNCIYRSLLHKLEY